MTFLGPLLIALIVGGIFFCTILALAACMRSGQLSKDDDAAASEGYVHYFAAAADKREVR